MSTSFDESKIRRQGAGSSAGGQFAAKSNSRPGASLSAGTSERQWEELNLREGSRTPWGPAQTIYGVAPGIAVASCAGHGGVKLSPERNREVPEALRNSDGWYEEDVEYNIPVVAFPDEFAAHHKRDISDESEASIRDYFPDKWEKWRGRTLQPGESRERDRQTWADRHKADPVVNSAIMSDTFPDMVRVSARIAETDERAEYLVPRDEYRARNDDNGDLGRDGRFVVDPARHAKLPPEQKDDRPANAPQQVLSDDDLHQRMREGRLSHRAYKNITGDLDQRWRRAGGKVMDLREIAETEGFARKTAYLDGSRRTYALVQEDGSSFRVKKDTWDAFSKVEDDRTDFDKVQQELMIYRDRLDAQRRNYDPVTPKQKARLRELEEKRDSLEGDDRARMSQAHERRQQIMADRERAARIEG